MQSFGSGTMTFSRTSTVSSKLSAARSALNSDASSCGFTPSQPSPLKGEGFEHLAVGN
jgi:hypothetical protein